MGSLFISFVRELATAVQNGQKCGEAVIEEGVQLIIAQHIADLVIGFRLPLQCAVWMKGPAEAIRALKKYLDDSHIPYEEFEKDLGAPDVPSGGTRSAP